MDSKVREGESSDRRYPLLTTPRDVSIDLFRTSVIETALSTMHGKDDKPDP